MTARFALVGSHVVERTRSRLMPDLFECTDKEHPGIGYLVAARRLADLTPRVAAERRRDRPVLVAAPFASAAAEIAKALDQQGIAVTRARRP